MIKNFTAALFGSALGAAGVILALKPGHDHRTQIAVAACKMRTYLKDGDCSEDNLRKSLIDYYALETGEAQKVYLAGHPTIEPLLCR